jgi:hypothetical protein
VSDRPRLPELRSNGKIEKNAKNENFGKNAKVANTGKIDVTGFWKVVLC